MISENSDMDRVINSVHNSMQSARSGLKNAAILRNLTELNPIVPNATRWYGKSERVNFSVRIRQELINEIHDAESSITIDTSSRFFEKPKKYGRITSEIDDVTKFLQEKSRPFSLCREDLDTLFEGIREAALGPNAPLHNCKLGTKYLSQDAYIVTNGVLETEVIKIQGGLTEDLTVGQRKEVEYLQK